MSQIETIYDLENIISQQANGLLSILMFSAEWCNPCKKIKNEINSISEYYKGAIKFFIIDNDKHPDLFDYFKIKNVPTFYFVTVGSSGKIEYLRPKISGGDKNKLLNEIDESLIMMN